LKRTLRIALYIYLAILLVLALLPLTGYYAAFAALPVVGYVLYRVFILEDKTPHEIVTRGTFLLACLVFLLGFALNMFCTLYTAYRSKQFRDSIEHDRKAIYQDLK
jgi:hypothetical protein